jgi:hypothetical protein
LNNKAPRYEDIWWSGGIPPPFLSQKVSHTCDTLVTNRGEMQSEMEHTPWTSRPVGLLPSGFNECNQQPDRQDGMKREKQKNLIRSPDFYGAPVKRRYSIRYSPDGLGKLAVHLS